MLLSQPNPPPALLHYNLISSSVCQHASVCVCVHLYLCLCAFVHLCDLNRTRISRRRRGHKHSFGRLHFLTPWHGHGQRLYPQCLCFTHLFQRTCRWVWPTWEARCSPTTGRQTATSPGSRRMLLVGFCIYCSIMWFRFAIRV